MRLTVSSLAVRPGCQRQAAEIFTMKIMLPIGSILEGLQKSTDFMARLLECNTHSRPERNTGICGDLLKHNAERTGTGALSGFGQATCGKRFLHFDDQSGYPVHKTYPEEKVSEIQGDHRFYSARSVARMIHGMPWNR